MHFGRGRERATSRFPGNLAGMIQLTRLNKEPWMVNSDLIKFVERSPDTVITLVGGEKIVVRESSEEILEKIIAFRRRIAQGPADRLGTSNPQSLATHDPKIGPEEQV